jgi:hypothetical protein
MPIVAFDDVVFKRSGDRGTFKAPFGVGLTILDEAKFCQNYDSILDDLFPLYQAERKKRVYKAAHLVGQLLDLSTEFIETFFKDDFKIV